MRRDGGGVCPDVVGVSASYAATNDAAPGTKHTSAQKYKEVGRDEGSITVLAWGREAEGRHLHPYGRTRPPCS